MSPWKTPSWWYKEDTRKLIQTLFYQFLQYKGSSEPGTELLWIWVCNSTVSKDNLTDADNFRAEGETTAAQGHHVVLTVQGHWSTLKKRRTANSKSQSGPWWGSDCYLSVIEVSETTRQLSLVFVHLLSSLIHSNTQLLLYHWLVLTTSSPPPITDKISQPRRRDLFDTWN